MLLELLPLDDERHARHVVYAVYFVRFLRDPALRAVARGAAPAVEDLVAGLLEGAPSTVQRRPSTRDAKPPCSWRPPRDCRRRSSWSR